MLMGRGPSTAGTPAAATLERLHGLGLDAEYLRCDVTDAAAVAGAVACVVARHGRVDALIHGAGVVEDAFIAFTPAASFKRVVATKVTGLKNLLDAATPHGLHTVLSLSSLAAVLGNVGQVSYCAANRAMAAATHAWAAARPGRRGLVLWLPPVAGAGMAESEDVREQLRMRGLDDGFLQLGEVAAVVRQELLASPATAARWSCCARRPAWLPLLACARTHLPPICCPLRPVF